MLQRNEKKLWKQVWQQTYYCTPYFFISRNTRYHCIHTIRLSSQQWIVQHRMITVLREYPSILTLFKRCVQQKCISQWDWISLDRGVNCLSFSKAIILIIHFWNRSTKYFQNMISKQNLIFTGNKPFLYRSNQVLHSCKANEAFWNWCCPSIPKAGKIKS
jgi:hypothetical protein